MQKKCTLYKTVNFIGKKWTLLILLEIHKGNNKWKRYSEIKKSLKEITPKILSARLKELEKEMLILKKVDSSKIPIKCEYALTKNGEDFIKIIKNVKEWTLKWKAQDKTCEDIDCKDCTI